MMHIKKCNNIALFNIGRYRIEVFMKIYINGRFLTQNITGVQRVGIEILKELDNILDKSKDEIIILTPKDADISVSFNNIKIQRIGFLKGHLWEQFFLPFASKRKLLINFCNTSPILKRNQITFIHDAAVYSCKNAYSKKFTLWYRLLYRCSALLDRKVITVSEFSKKELVNYIPMLKGKIEVIHNGVEHFQDIDIDETIFDLKNIKRENYILAVGSLHPNKNFQIIVDSLKDLDNNITLVIAGGFNEKVFSNASNFNCDNVIRVGYVSDEQLKALYKHAKAFVFPSVYEGFGIPPLEAMSVGCPVIASEAASIPEVCGEAAIYFEPTNRSQLIHQINTIYNSDNIVSDLYSKGIKQSEKFSWKKSSEKLYKIIKSMNTA